MNDVWIRGIDRHRLLYVLNSHKQMSTIPMVGDEIYTDNKDFTQSSPKVRPWRNDKSGISKAIHLQFVVKSRVYNTHDNEWELTCEPTVESLIFCLKNAKA